MPDASTRPLMCTHCASANVAKRAEVVQPQWQLQHTWTQTALLLHHSSPVHACPLASARTIPSKPHDMDLQACTHHHAPLTSQQLASLGLVMEAALALSP